MALRLLGMFGPVATKSAPDSISRLSIISDSLPGILCGEKFAVNHNILCISLLITGIKMCEACE